MLSCGTVYYAVKDVSKGTVKQETYLATVLQNELNSDAARFTTHIKPVLQQIMLLTGMMWVVERAQSLLNSFCSNNVEQVERFFYAC